MTDIVVHLRTPTPCRGPFAAALTNSFDRVTLVHGTRRALDELPDSVLRDMGVARSDIPFVDGALACADGDQSCAAFDRLNRSTVKCDGPVRRLQHGGLRLALAAVIAVSAFVIFSRAILA